MEQTILDLLTRRHPEMVRMWDGWNYKVTGPMSLDDVAVVTVVLENKTGKFSAIGLPLAEK